MTSRPGVFVFSWSSEALGVQDVFSGWCLDNISRSFRPGVLVLVLLGVRIWIGIAWMELDFEAALQGVSVMHSGISCFYILGFFWSCVMDGVQGSFRIQYIWVLSFGFRNSAF